MEPGPPRNPEAEVKRLNSSEQPEMIHHRNEKEQLGKITLEAQCTLLIVRIEYLNMKVAVLLNREQHAVPFLSAAQCHTVIDTLKRMQRARDIEIIQTMKPFTDSLDEVLPRLKEWKRLYHGSGLHQPHAELKFKLEQLAKTDLGMKPGSFSIEGDVLLAIEASNKILRALAVEKKYVGLSKPMSLLKRNVKQSMINVQGLLVNIIDALQPIPGERFYPSDVLDPTKGQVVLRRGRPFYVDPLDNDLVICGPKHPLIKAPGSEWNKWLRIPRAEWNGLDRWMRFSIPDGPFRHLREQFLEALQVESDNTFARKSSWDGYFGSRRQVLFADISGLVNR